MAVSCQIMYPTREYYENLLKSHEDKYHKYCENCKKTSIENFTNTINIIDINNINSFAKAFNKISLNLDEKIINAYSKLFNIQISCSLGSFVKCNLLTPFSILQLILDKACLTNEHFDFYSELNLKIIDIFGKEVSSILGFDNGFDNNIVKSKFYFLNDEYLEKNIHLPNEIQYQKRMYALDTMYYIYFKHYIKTFKDELNNYVIVFDKVIIVLHNKLGILILTENAYVIINNRKYYYKNNDGTFINLKHQNLSINNPVINSSIFDKKNDTMHIINVNLDSSLTKTIESFQKNLSKKTTSYFKEKTLSNGDVTGISKEGNYFSFEHISKSKGIRIFKSNYYWDSNYICDSNSFNSSNSSNSSSTLRFRGTYTNVQNLNTNVSNTKLTLNGKTEYAKKNNIILVDDITPKTKITNKIIGWKIAKDDKSDPVIIKLEIEPDAKIVRAINEEYYFTHQKERCNRAKVIDIQKLKFSDPYEEISIGDKCSNAYSYVFEKSSGFKYTIGTVVIPDKFDEDTNAGCTNGIHYFQDRKSLFHTYAKEYQNKHIKQD